MQPVGNGNQREKAVKKKKMLVPSFRKPLVQMGLRVSLELMPDGF